ncbi:hypothetical protein OPV22_027311 [Ensete ventricosum]|uniref:Uncharacterized protein n=1 Tax=Ensete ventricosum TaxID=4639 RepID=A0AAV8PZQ5_ENSVE|nr:hypothetical protein OPV22_027311 [Ensete ventricosum]
MATSPAELARLFAELASYIQRREDDTDGGDGVGPGGGLASAISSLAASLSFGDAPRVGVLDAALSLMCFRASELCCFQVHRARLECLVGTIVAMLSSSVSCKVLRLPDGRDGEFLRIGTSLSSEDCVQLIRVCVDVLASLKGHCGAGDSHALLYAVVKAVISSSPYQGLLPSLPIGCLRNEDTDCGVQTEISKLAYSLSDQTSCTGNEFPLRLQFWYLDPLILKHDISEILKEVIRRPFLCLRKELHDRMSWRNIITCLVTSPTIFVETKATLHRWFLFTGLTSVLDLKIGIVLSVLDILSRPMWWGVPVELGLRFPCSYAYFSIRHHELLTILAGQLSCKNLLHLVQYIKTEVATLPNICQSASHPSITNYNHEGLANMIGSNSAWSVLIDFPAWFYFANALIFFYRNNSQDYLSEAICSRLRAEPVNDLELHQAAIYYISWVLCPIGEAHRDVLAENIDELSRSFMMQHKAKSIYEERSISDRHPKNVLSHSKKLEIPKVNSFEKHRMAPQEVSSLNVGVWLEKFNAIHIKMCNESTASSNVQSAVTSEQDANMKPNLLLARVPIGILLASPSYLDELGCEILLHYAATGETMQLKEMQKLKDHYDYGDLGVLFNGAPSKWAVKGACLVFNLLDIIEDMSIMLFDSEDNRIGFVKQMKGKAGFHGILVCVLSGASAVFKRLAEWKQPSLGYLYLLIYICLSSGVLLYNQGVGRRTRRRQIRRVTAGTLGLVVRKNSLMSKTAQISGPLVFLPQPAAVSDGLLQE